MQSYGVSTPYIENTRGTGIVIFGLSGCVAVRVGMGIGEKFSIVDERKGTLKKKEEKRSDSKVQQK